MLRLRESASGDDIKEANKQAFSGCCSEVQHGIGCTEGNGREG